MNPHLDYIIVKKTVIDPPPQRPGVRMRSATKSSPAIGTAAKLDISCEKLSTKDVRDIQRQDSSRTVVPMMPMQLIKPRSRGGIIPGENITPWGLLDLGVANTQLTGQSITVAVLDTGIDRTHEAFAHLKAEQLIEKDYTNEGHGDTDGHGTHCAGTIFGGMVNGTRIGIAPGVKKVLIAKVIGANGSTTVMLYDAINWAVENGANVISMSVGIDFPGFAKMLTEYHDYSVELATSKALESYRQNVRLFDDLAKTIRSVESFRQPAILVAAAGNSSQRDVDANYTIQVEPPATADGILSVGAIGKKENGYEIASFSNIGASIVGPGVDIISAKTGGGLCSMSGTSMATPHVAGAAVLWADYLNAPNRKLSIDNLLLKLKGNAKQLQELDSVDVGSGLVQLPR